MFLPETVSQNTLTEEMRSPPSATLEVTLNIEDLNTHIEVTARVTAMRLHNYILFISSKIWSIMTKEKSEIVMPHK